MPILESLDKIDWASLSHAYGSAEDVPGLIRQRASTNPKEAEEAEGGLFGTIWHQGTVYEATAYAVPFLVELIERQMTHSREGLVLLLASISEGSSYLEVHKSHSHFASQDQDEIEAKLIKELEWKTRARDAVQRYAESYWTLLDDSSQRTTIPYLLSKLPAEAEHVRDRFPDRIATANDALFLASLLLGLAIASRTAPDAFARFTSFIHHDTPVVRLGAALGVLIRARRRLGLTKPWTSISRHFAIARPMVQVITPGFGEWATSTRCCGIQFHSLSPPRSGH